MPKSGLWAAMITALFAGAALGAWSAHAYIAGDIGSLSVRNGQWSTDPAIGSRDAGPYTRAAIAKRGLLALSKEEAVYFFTDTDSQGRRLQADCEYRFQGTDLPARWWSYTLYAEDDFLPANGDGAYSVSASTAVKDPDGRYQITISQEPSGSENWLSSRDAGKFSIVVRLYNPLTTITDNPASINLPLVERKTCSGDA